MSHMARPTNPSDHGLLNFADPHLPQISVMYFIDNPKEQHKNKTINKVKVNNKETTLNKPSYTLQTVRDMDRTHLCFAAKR